MPEIRKRYDATGGSYADAITDAQPWDGNPGWAEISTDLDRHSTWGGQQAQLICAAALTSINAGRTPLLGVRVVGDDGVRISWAEKGQPLSSCHPS